MLKKTYALLLFLVLVVGAIEAGGYGRRTNLTHATDCTALTDGRKGEKCTDEDDFRVWTCFPSTAAGLCDTAGEWKRDPDVGSGGGSIAYNSLGKWPNGRWFGIETALAIGSGGNGSDDGTTWAVDTIAFTPLCTGTTSQAIDRLGIRVNTGGPSGARLRLGLWANDAATSKPTGTPIVDSGELTVESSGVDATFTTSQTLSAATCYWLGAVKNTTAGSTLKIVFTLGRDSKVGGGALGHVGLDRPERPGVGWNMAHTEASSLPTPSSLTISDLAQTPRVMVRSAN